MKLVNLRRSQLVVITMATCLAGCAETRQAPASDSLPSAADTRSGVPSGPPASAVSARLPAASDTVRLAMPRIVPKFCEGEGCAFGYSLVACTALTLRAADDSSSPAVGHVAAGDTVVVETGNLYVHAPGIAVMRRAAVVEYDTVPYEYAALEDSLRLATGDTVRFLEYYGEGNWGVAHKGRVVFVQEFWPQLGSPSRWDEGKPAMTVSSPEVAQWLRLQTRQGTAGWWQEESSKTARPEWDERCGTLTTLYLTPAPLAHGDTTAIDTTSAGVAVRAVERLALRYGLMPERPSADGCNQAWIAHDYDGGRQQLLHICATTAPAGALTVKVLQLVGWSAKSDSLRRALADTLALYGTVRISDPAGAT